MIPGRTSGCHTGALLYLRPLVGHFAWTAKLRPAFSSRGNFLWKNSPYAALFRFNLSAKIPYSAASLLYPVSGGPRQPLDRQLRYYREASRLASPKHTTIAQSARIGVFPVWDQPSSPVAQPLLPLF
jgi:hypothetical protein